MENGQQPQATKASRMSTAENSPSSWTTLPISAVRSQLALAFGGAFAIWRRMPHGWSCESSGDACLPSPASSELAEWFERLLEESLAEPQIATLANGEVHTAVVCGGESEAVVVCGRIELDPRRLAGSLAASALRQAEHQAERESHQELLDSYAERLIHSFEDSTFLRRLSRFVEYCDTRRTMEDVARFVLPELCEILRLEGLVLLEAPADPPANQAEPGRVLLSQGNPTGSEDFWRRTIARLGDSAAKQTFVKNYFGVGPPETPPIPGLRSLVIAPLLSNGIAYGWILGTNKLPPDDNSPRFLLGDDQIGSIEGSLLEATALMLGSHAANCRLFREKESLVVDVIHALVGVIEAKDAYTCGHSDRVALIARRLAEELGLGAGDCHDIYLAGLLHDIGKVGVADDVLLKSSKLSDEEYALIKRHPRTGADLLQGLKPLAKLIPGVLHHHEAYDGSGYPAGLAGAEIPLMARILAVADAYDAMTSSRPYRVGMPKAKADAILRDGAGKQWDATVVEALAAAHQDIDQIGFQWQEHLRQVLNQREAKAESQTAIGAAAFLSVNGSEAPPAPPLSSAFAR